MNLLDASPMDWLRSVLERQEDVREVSFGVPPNQEKLVLVTSSGVRYYVTLRPVNPFEEA